MNNRLTIYISGLCLGLLLLLSQAPLASAHDLEENNGTAVALHVEPDDKPVAGTPTELELLFSKNVGGFQMNNYIIKLQVIEHGKQQQQVIVTPAFFGAADKGRATVTFPKIDTYQVTLTGVSKSNPESNFKMNYEVKVPWSLQTSHLGTGVLVGTGTATVIFGFGAVMFKRK